MSPRTQLYTLIGMSFLFAGGFTSVSPVLPEVMSTFGVSGARAGLLLSAFAGGRMAFSIVGGMIADRVAVARVVGAACVLAIVGSAVAIWSTDFGALLLGRVLQGIGTSLYMVAAIGHIISVASPDRLASLLAWNQSLLLVGVSVGPTLGGLAAEVLGYRGPFVLFATYGALGLVSTLVILRGTSRSKIGHQAEPPGEPVEVAVSRWPLIRRMIVSPIFLVVLAVSFIASAIRAGVRSTVVPLYAAELLDFDAAQLGFLLTVAGLANIVALYPVVKTIEFAGWRRVMSISLPLCALPLAAFAFVGTSWQMFTTLAALAMTSGFSGVVAGSAIAELAAPSIRTTVVGIDRTVRDFAFFVSPVLATGVADSMGYSTLFIGLTVIVLVLGGVVAVAARGRPVGAQAGP